METRLLEYFVAVADELNFTRAAARSFATQSTVSAGIRALERDLGATLFTRDTKRVELTPAGQALLEDARAVLDGVEHLRSAAAGSGAELRGRVRVGIFTNLPGIDLPALAGAFRTRHPLVDLRLTASSTGSTGFADDVRTGRLDVAFMGLPREDLAGLAVHPLLTTRFVAVLPTAHPLAHADRVALSDLADDRFVDTPEGFGNRVVLERAFAASGLRRSVSTEAPDLGQIPRFVAAGLGIAVIPDLGLGAAADIAGNVAVVPLTERLGWELSAITRPRTTAPVDALLDQLRTSVTPPPPTG
ncbi:LysR family transcriptional regulator [Herbiconiux sp. L3-i23]|uniref:LysR family transcriptional regulator n=1 Tax=Herbiconiux sp. L3-i23 TaxID=2905871 RepID=UPI0020575CDB|nr:LysR family transcriptional regulator [Herbiconiux sp. L3-i23]BDI22170.1 transcriptional regulator [Herbiconiux sp. L3-i23]